MSVQEPARAPSSGPERQREGGAGGAARPDDASNGEGGQSADDGRQESPLERLDRNTAEMVQEMRVASVGIQVLFAFLLVVPFNTGWKQVTSFDRAVYYVTLSCIAVATALLIAPTVHHRILFRHGEKPFIVRTGNAMMIVAMMFEAVGLVGILVLISHVVFGGTMAAVAGVLCAAVLGALWFAIPLVRLQTIRRHDATNPGSPRDKSG